ncbi:MAG TPA: hypothetical protein VHP33_13315 [Polyangiaceae bacterium]|nr:hypothetical protein [Polyangiaceae bacterium]
MLWVGFVLQALTYCSGSSDRGGDGGSAGLGFAGHTADCLNVCHGGCADFMCRGGNGGTATSGAGGALAGNGGANAGNAGFGGFGFSGHTGNCLNGCGPTCGVPCGGTGGVSAGGTPAASGGMGGALDGLAGEAGQAAGGEPAAMRRSPPSESRACYELTGYEADPCLPPDDSLLEWLNAPNLGCKLSVDGGPTLMTGPIGRACCYSVSCAQPSD